MDNLHIVNLASYNRPKISEDKNRDWVEYGDDNDYYSYLIDLYTNSTTNHSIINGISNMIYGKGLDALDSNKKPNEYAAMRSIVSDSCLRKVVLDLKLLGEGSFQVLYQKGEVKKAEHFPRQTLRAEKCNEDGEIEAYYYHPKWKDVKRSDKPQRIAAFGFGNGNEPEIKIVKKYVSGYDYYCPPDYQGGLAYAELESEVADYLINDVQNGFSGTKVVNFNNGVPDREKQMQIKSDVMRKLTGARGQKVIVAFNNNAESKTTVDDIPLNDAPEHYQYLSKEAEQKILVGHNVVSPMLVGVVTDNQGFSSNADEIEVAAKYFYNSVIVPFQETLIDAFQRILNFNGVELDLYFRRLNLLESIEEEEQKSEEVGFSSQETFLDAFGEDESDEWELIDVREVDYELEDELDAQVKEWEDKINEPSFLSKVWNFVST